MNSSGSVGRCRKRIVAIVMFVQHSTVVKINPASSACRIKRPHDYNICTMDYCQGEAHMRLIYLSSLLLTLLCASGKLSAAGLVTTIEKDHAGNWRVHYSADSAMTRLVFQRSPDQSRQTRWKPESAAFEIVSLDGHEAVRRTDGKAFTTVGFRLTPTYVVLPKE